MNTNNFRILLAIIFIGFGLAQAPAQICTPAPVGLVAAYSGDNNALDVRSRSNGTLQNGATFAAGFVGQAFSFDGVDDQITAPHVENQNTGSGITVEAWINPTTIPHGGTIVQKRSASNQGGFVLELAGAPSSNPNSFQFCIQALGGPFNCLNTPANSITPGVWQHVAGTFDFGVLRGYVNGVEVASQTISAQSIEPSNAPITIGRNVVTGQGFNGRIDEIGLYNRVLSAAEIQAIYNSGTTGKCKPIATNAPDNQVLWMAGDGDANDLSGYGNNGTLENGAGFAVGKVGQNFTFDGVDDRVLIGNPASLQLQTFTIESWVKRTSASVVTNNGEAGGPGGNVFAYGQDGYSIGIHQATGRLFLSKVGVSIVFSTLTVTDINYHHIVVAQSGGTTTFYVDGVADTPVSYNPTFAFTTNAAIGSRGDTNPKNSFFGSVDELSIYNRALSVAEIQSIYNADLAGKYKVQSTVPANIAAWYPGDGNTNDIQAGNTATLQGGATYANGKVGQAFSLNGTTAYVSAPSTAGNDPTGAANGASMEAWFYLNQLPSAAGHTMYIMSKTGNTFMGPDTFELRIDTDDRVKFIWRGNGVDANIIVQTGVWYHVVGEFSLATQDLKIFVNGSLRANGANGPSGRTQSNAPLDIGHSLALGGPSFFNGLIDEPAIYNRTLTSDEIRDLYYAGSSGKYKAATNPTVSNKTKTGDAEVTFDTITNASAVHLTPLNSALLPALPMGTNTGLNFDVSTTATYTNPTVCFKVPTFTPSQFVNLRVFHLESGVWQNRTGTWNAYPNLCTMGLTSLSPFAIGLNAPTAAEVSIGGRVSTATGRGIRNVRVSLTDASGETQTVLTNPFGYYRFKEVAAGATYILSVSAKRYQFSQPTQVVSASEDLSGIDFTALP